jgi:hypothetical protein
MYEAAQKYTPNDVMRGAQKALQDSGVSKALNDFANTAVNKAILNSLGESKKSIDNAFTGVLNSNPAVRNMVGELNKATIPVLNQIGNQTFAETAKMIGKDVGQAATNYQNFVQQEYKASMNAENPAAPAGQLAQSFVRAENLIGQKGVEGAVNQVITNTTEMLRQFNQQQNAQTK